MDWMSTKDSALGFEEIVEQVAPVEFADGAHDAPPQCNRCDNDNLTDGPLCRACCERDALAESERRYWERAAAMADPHCPACDGRGAITVSDDNGADYAPAFSVQERCDCVRAAERAALEAAPPIEEEDAFLAAFMPQAA